MKLTIAAPDLFGILETIKDQGPQKYPRKVKISCKDDCYTITATNSYTLVQLWRKHIGQDTERGEVVFDYVDLKKAVKASDKFLYIDTNEDTPEYVNMTICNKNNDLSNGREASFFLKNSGFPCEESVDKLLDYTQDTESKEIVLNAKFVKNLFGGLDRIYPKTNTDIRFQGAHKPFYVEAGQRDKTNTLVSKTTGIIMPCNKRH